MTDVDRAKDREVVIHEAAEQLKILAQAAKIASERLAGEAKDATRAVAVAASEAVKVSSSRTADDHDLLIKIDTQVLGLKDDIRDLKNVTAIKIEDHEKRIVAVELCQSLSSGTSQGMAKFYGWIVSGVMALIVFLSFVLPRLK